MKDFLFNRYGLILFFKPDDGSGTDGNDNDDNADDIDYIAEIKRIKEQSVSKEKYDKLREENRRLLSNLIDGTRPDEGDAPEKKPSIDELRKKLYASDQTLSNIEYISTVLDLRDAVIESGDPDPFLPTGPNADISDDTVAKAKNVADVLRQCVDESDGNSAIFTAKLQNRMRDVNPMIRSR